MKHLAAAPGTGEDSSPIPAVIFDDVERPSCRLDRFIVDAFYAVNATAE
jgi:hypothetical protein